MYLLDRNDFIALMGLLVQAFSSRGDSASSEAVGFSKRCRRPLVQKPFDFDALFAIVAGSSSSNQRKAAAS